MRCLSLRLRGRIGLRRHAVVAGAAISAIASALHLSPSPSAAGFAELDVVAVDRGGHHAEGLRADEFELREYKRLVPILGVDEVSNASSRAGVSMIIVLDDLSVGQAGAESIRSIAHAVLSRARLNDRVTVQFLAHPDTTTFSRDRLDLSERIDRFRAGDESFRSFEGIGAWLHLVSHISNQLEQSDGQRKIVVGIGTASLLDPEEPSAEHMHGGLWPVWADALSSSARANVAVYVLDPALASGLWTLSADGFAAQTGGQRFLTMDLNRAIDELWRDARHYYMVSYVPLAGAGTLQPLRLTVRRRGVELKVRRMIGE